MCVQTSGSSLDHCHPLTASILFSASVGKFGAVCVGSSLMFVACHLPYPLYRYAFQTRASEERPRFKYWIETIKTP